MEELKRAQELRVDEFSIQKLRESHETIQRVTSQVQELQERMTYLKDFGEFQEVEANYGGKFRVEKKEPQRLESVWENQSTAVQKLLKHVLARDHLVSIGILPNVNKTKRNRDVSSAPSAHSRTGRFKNNQKKKRKRVMTKVQLLL